MNKIKVNITFQHAGNGSYCTWTYGVDILYSILRQMGMPEDIEMIHSVELPNIIQGREAGKNTLTFPEAERAEQAKMLLSLLEPLTINKRE